MRSKLIIHTSKLDKNLTAIDKRLNQGIKKMAVIKDNAYGHGLVEIARYLEPKVEWFCVARVDEGITLRKHGIKIPILVFEVPDKQRVNDYPAFNLVATVADNASFDILADGTEYHLNFDTGMRRLGIPPHEADKTLQLTKLYKSLRCTGIYTHFATADVASSSKVEEQLNLFRSIRSHFPDFLMTHTANTGAIFYYTHLDLQFDAVRPGVCLYGYYPGDEEIPDLEPVIEWKSHIMQVRKIEKGDSVGYGATWIAPGDGWIGTVPVGYADGIHRMLGGKIKFLVGDDLMQQVGRIAMDYMGVYSNKREILLNEEVTLLNGLNLHPKYWAKTAQTIPYEIATSLNANILRYYEG